MVGEAQTGNPQTLSEFILSQLNALSTESRERMLRECGEKLTFGDWVNTIERQYIQDINTWLDRLYLLYKNYILCTAKIILLEGLRDYLAGEVDASFIRQGHNEEYAETVWNQDHIKNFTTLILCGHDEGKLTPEKSVLHRAHTRSGKVISKFYANERNFLAISSAECKENFKKMDATYQLFRSKMAVTDKFPSLLKFFDKNTLEEWLERELTDFFSALLAEDNKLNQEALNSESTSLNRDQDACASGFSQCLNEKDAVFDLMQKSCQPPIELYESLDESPASVISRMEPQLQQEFSPLLCLGGYLTSDNRSSPNGAVWRTQNDKLLAAIYEDTWKNNGFPKCILRALHELLSCAEDEAQLSIKDNSGKSRRAVFLQYRTSLFLYSHKDLKEAHPHLPGAMCILEYNYYHGLYNPGRIEDANFAQLPIQKEFAEFLNDFKEQLNSRKQYLEEGKEKNFIIRWLFYGSKEAIENESVEIELIIKKLEEVGDNQLEFMKFYNWVNLLIHNDGPNTSTNFPLLSMKGSGLYNIFLQSLQKLEGTLLQLPKVQTLNEAFYTMGEKARKATPVRPEHEVDIGGGIGGDLEPTSVPAGQNNRPQFLHGSTQNASRDVEDEVKESARFCGVCCM